MHFVSEAERAAVLYRSRGPSLPAQKPRSGANCVH